MKRLILLLISVLSFICNIEAQRVYVYESTDVCEGRKDALGYEFGEWRKSNRYTFELDFDEYTNKLQNISLTLDKNVFEPLYEVEISIEKLVEDGKLKQKVWLTKKNKYGRVDIFRMLKHEDGTICFVLEINEKVHVFVVKLINSFTNGEIIPLY